MTTIGEWLASFGLAQYAPSFEQNDIDASVLSDLTDQDLKDIGVSLVHRRKIMRLAAEQRWAVAAIEVSMMR